MERPVAYGENHQALLAAWEHPRGVELDFDNLDFLYIPDFAHQAMVEAVTERFARYQSELVAMGSGISTAVMVMMGGLYPGALFADHFQGYPTLRDIHFTTIGTAFYEGPGKPLKEPQIIQDVPNSLSGVVVLVEDLGDSGRSMMFLKDHLVTTCGADGVVPLMVYCKPPAKELFDVTPFFFHCEVPKNTWIITPRERVETMVKRVPYWRMVSGVSEAEVRHALEEIGYQTSLIDRYLPSIEVGIRAGEYDYLRQ